MTGENIMIGLVCFCLMIMGLFIFCTADMDIDMGWFGKIVRWREPVKWHKSGIKLMGIFFILYGLIFVLRSI